MTRGARRFRSSRMLCSSCATSMTFWRRRCAREIADRFGRSRGAAAWMTACADRPSRRRAPAARVAQPALAHHGVVQIEPRELDLPRPIAGQRWSFDAPVVERPVILELQRAQRMRDVLERVGQGVRVVVHRVDAPRVAGPVVGRPADPVERRIAHVHVGRRHVDLCAQHQRAVREFAGPHPGEQVEAFLDGRWYGLSGQLGQRAGTAISSAVRLST